MKSTVEKSLKIRRMTARTGLTRSRTIDDIGDGGDPCTRRDGNRASGPCERADPRWR